MSAMIGLLVDRVHIWSSNRRVIREVWDAMTVTARHDPASRERRKAYYREALERHHGNQELCRAFRL